MNEICPHGRVVGHTCLDCPDGVASDPYDPAGLKTMIDEKKISADCSNDTGLNASYYQIPKLVFQDTGDDYFDLMDLIEFFEDGGMRSAGMNILKSLCREYNPVAQKETTPEYEAEKRFYYSDRHLSKVQKAKEVRRRLPNVSEGEETP